MNNKNIVAAIYLHPELYPPTLNALDLFSDCADRVFVIARNVIFSEWTYPENVQLILSGKYKPLRQSEKMPTFWKIMSFIRFSVSLFRIIKKNRPALVVCYDSISLFSFRLISYFLSYRPVLWYHNHDVVENNNLKKLSLNGIAALYEPKQFSRIDIFSLPSPERLMYFPIDKLKGEYFIIPNYPSKKRKHPSPYKNENPEKQLRLIYQGSISYGHGLEEIIEFIGFNKDISLTIIGSGGTDYISILSSLIDQNRVNDRVFLQDAVSYSRLAEITRKHHIGLAIHKPLNIIYSTGGMASNKIYEYMAAGLPILYYDNEHYNKYLSKYKWAFPNNLSNTKLKEQIEYISVNFSTLSAFALNDFEMELNFENVFEPVLSYLEQHGNKVKFRDYNL